MWPQLQQHPAEMMSVRLSVCVYATADTMTHIEKMRFQAAMQALRGKQSPRPPNTSEYESASKSVAGSAANRKSAWVAEGQTDVVEVEAE